ncbi:hypothetical protein AB4Z25_21310 [Rhizobium sp. RAF36]|uniref:hypothetical protein n=1 Tax=Rhizobium sp. RAF36 TaxID=3233055 RepID=UPI003F957A38
MNKCPEYRLRLFLSVDLVGSTAFKSNPNAGWVDRFKHFYREFPRIVDLVYRETKSCRNDNMELTSGPKLWKLVGDEILFCCRVQSLQHLSCATMAFLDALEQYGSIIDEDPDTSTLDVKGAGWVAVFPAENVSLKIEGSNIRSTKDGVDYLTKGFEAEADAKPAQFDFIGPAIDAGFRSSKNASADRFSSSVELAYLLADAANKNLFLRPFSYHGRSPLKGVHRNAPYPVISINSERDPLKRDLLARERVLTNDQEAAPLHLREFLQAYMELNGLELPKLKLKNDSPEEMPPSSYEKFRESWDVTSKGTKEQDDSISEAEKPASDAPNPAPLDDAIKRFAEHVSAQAKSFNTAEILERARIAQSTASLVARQIEAQRRALQVPIPVSKVKNSGKNDDSTTAKRTDKKDSD